VALRGVELPDAGEVGFVISGHWIGPSKLGSILGGPILEAGAFTQADSEFDRCIRRRGETLAFFLDEEPTDGFLPQVYYYQGRVRES
jgi:hypothetical protein